MITYGSMHLFIALSLLTITIQSTDVRAQDISPVLYLSNVSCIKSFDSTDEKSTLLLRKKIEEWMQNPEASIEALSVSHKIIEKYEEYLGSGYHGFVVKVIAEKKPMALKLFRRERDSESMLAPVLIQMILSQFGFGAPIRGILSTKELHEVKKLYNDTELSLKGMHLGHKLDFDEYSYGVLMDYIPIAWKSKGGTYLGVGQSSLDEEKIEKDLKTLSVLLPRLGIYSNDLDVVISSDYRVQIIDFDFYFFKGLSGVVYPQRSEDLFHRPSVSLLEGPLEEVDQSVTDIIQQLPWKRKNGNKK